jgi:hypothetical protein
VIRVTPKNFVLLYTFVKEHVLQYHAILDSRFHSLAMFEICFDTLQFLYASNIVNLFNVQHLKTDLTFQDTACNRKHDELKNVHMVVACFGHVHKT